MKLCLICKEYLEDAVIKCGKCGATQPKSTVTLPDRPARYSIQVVPMGWFSGSPAHALLFDDQSVHDIVLKLMDETSENAVSLLIGASNLDIIKLLSSRKGWAKLKDLPMSKFASRFELARSIPYASLAWFGMNVEAVGGYSLIFALNTGRYRVYLTGSTLAAPEPQDAANGIYAVIGKKFNWDSEHDVPKDKCEK